MIEPSATPRRMSSLRAEQGQVRQRRQSAAAPPKPAHGFARATDQGGRRVNSEPVAPARTGGRGLVILFALVLGVLTHAGIARVVDHNQVLELGGQVATLTAKRTQLMQQKRRLEAERAFLRHPDRIRGRAVEVLEMTPTPPERVQRIELLANGLVKLPAKPSAQEQAVTSHSNEEAP